MNKLISLATVLAALCPVSTCLAQETRPAGAGVTYDLALDVNALDMDKLRASRMGYQPSSFRLVDAKPAGVTKEPAYAGKPKYGMLRVGNGPRSATFFVVDEPEGKQGKLYVDTNQNGDLTDDGNTDWKSVRVVDGVRNYMTTFTVGASWGNGLSESESGTYAMQMYMREGANSGGYTKMSGRTGSVTLGGKAYNVVLAENMSDGIFTVPAVGDTTRRPVELMIDLDGDGTFKGMVRTVDGKEMKYPERFAVAEPVQVDGTWYKFRPSMSGAKLTVTEVEAPEMAAGGAAVAQAPTEVVRMPVKGQAAPAFTVQKPDGSPVSLADYRGKVVVLDFWATWCGPCQAAMPGLERVNKAVKDQGVVVFSVNVWDTKPAFEAWMAKNAGTKYTFDFAIDTLGRAKGNVAAGLYGVTGIPTMFVIDREGKVSAALVGSGKEEALMEALKELGVTVAAP